MRKHEKFLQFNGKNIVFMTIDGQYWVALKPILDALNLPADRYLKRTRRDPFFSTYLDNMSIQVPESGAKQARSMTCLPEMYIYGWISTLNADDPELNRFKKTCYKLLYNHFHGTITNRKELLLERTEIDKDIKDLELHLKEHDEKFKMLSDKKSRRKLLSTQLNTMDKELVKQPKLFDRNTDADHE